MLNATTFPWIKPLLHKERKCESATCFCDLLHLIRFFIRFFKLISFSLKFNKMKLNCFWSSNGLSHFVVVKMLKKITSKHSNLRNDLLSHTKVCHYDTSFSLNRFFAQKNRVNNSGSLNYLPIRRHILKVETHDRNIKTDQKFLYNKILKDMWIVHIFFDTQFVQKEKNQVKKVSNSI